MNFSKIVSIVPLFIVILMIYNIMAYFGVDFNFESSQALFTVPLPSGATWKPTWSGILILLGVITLYVELLKSTKTGTATIVEHALSMVVFIAFLMEFILVKFAGTSTFLIITLMSLLEVVAGFTITVASARRDFTMGG
jgi:hypothetical protein